MKTSALEVGAIYRLATSHSSDSPAAVLDTRRRWRYREPKSGPAACGYTTVHYFASGATVPDGFRAPIPDAVGVPVLLLPNVGKGYGDERLERLLDAARAVLAAGDLPDVVDVADLRRLINAAVLDDGADRRLIQPMIARPERLRAPWAGSPATREENTR